MRDWNTGKVVLTKVIRRKGFVLGKSTVLSVRHVAEMANGDIRVVSERYDGTISSVHMRWATYEKCVKDLRHFEREFITGELRSWTRSKVSA